MRCKTLLLLILVLSIYTSYATSLSHNITQVLTHHTPYLNVGVLVENADNATTYYYLNPKRYYTPASNTKLFTAAAALLSLGPTFRFDTSISKLCNNVYLKFSGDPSLSKNDITHLLQQAKTKGLTHIKGNLILDTTTFSGPAHPLGWVASDMSYCFGAPIDSIIIDQNCTYITLFKKGWFAVPSPSEKLPINASGRVILQPSTNPKTCVFHITDKPDNQVIFSGCLPSRASWGFPLAVPNPTLYAQQLIRQDLTTLGIHLAGKVIIGKQPTDASILATHQSDTLQRLLQVMLQQSNNVYAGALTKTIGLHYYGIGNHKAGVNAINEILRKQLGASFTLPNLEGGAGGSTYNQVTPTQIAQVLYGMYHSRYKNNFLRALAVSGRLGTLAYRMTSKELRGHVLGKTGSMTGVSTLSGYLLRPHHRALIVVILMNGVHGSLRPARSTQDLIIQAINQSE